MTQFTDDDGKPGSGQSGPHVLTHTQQGADTPGHRASEAAGNVADPHGTPIGHRSAGLSSSGFLPVPVRLFDSMDETRPPDAPSWWAPVHYPWWDSGCEREHSAALRCADGCRQRPPPLAIAIARPSWLERLIRWITEG